MKITKSLKLQALWYTYYGFVKAMFESDPEVNVGEFIVDGSKYTLPVEVLSHKKFLALHDIMIQNFEFGNITMQIQLLDKENSMKSSASNIDKLKAAFKDNTAVGKIIEQELPTGLKQAFVCFQPEVVQFYNDDISDYAGNFNGLMEDIARDLFNVDWNTSFCTVDKRED